MLRNVSGLLGAMVAVAIILNVINRFSNKRRNAKLRKSIFTLPVYVYPSTEKKAAAVKQARELLHCKYLVHCNCAQDATAVKNLLFWRVPAAYYDDVKLELRLLKKGYSIGFRLTFLAKHKRLAVDSYI